MWLIANFTIITKQENTQQADRSERQTQTRRDKEEGSVEVPLLGRGGQAALTLQREWVRWRGELMSLGVDERSPSAAEASEMTEGWREWQGLILTTAECTTHAKCPPLTWETSRKPSVSMISKQHQAVRKLRGRAERAPTLSLSGVSVVQGLLALTDGSREWKVGLHHPLLTTVHHGLRRHGQWVPLRYVFSQGGERLLCLRCTKKQRMTHFGSVPVYSSYCCKLS